MTTIGKVTRRAWLILAVGAVLAASLGGVALANRGSSATFAPTASWNMFPPAQWDALKARAAAKGLDPATLHVVGATSRHGGEPLLAVPHGFVFAGGQSGAATTYIARNRAGRVVARIRVAPRGH